jgi:hypothetical protein
MDIQFLKRAYKIPGIPKENSYIKPKMPRIPQKIEIVCIISTIY